MSYDYVKAKVLNIRGGPAPGNAVNSRSMARAGQSVPDNLDPEILLLARESFADDEQTEQRHELSTRRRVASSRRHLRLAMARIPEVERHVLDLHFRELSRGRIAEILGVSQPAVTYRLARAQARLAWVVGTGALFTARDARQALSARFDPQTTSLLALYWSTTSVVRAGRILGVKKATALYRLTRAIRRLPEMAAQDRRLRRFAEGFAALMLAGPILDETLDCRGRRKA